MNTEVKAFAKNPFYDILKGLGIIAVVLGHCHPDTSVLPVRLMYGFHLAIFFFIAGMQFNDEKYSTAPFILVSNRIKSLWPSFFGYLTFFTLTQNLCVNWHLLPQREPYTLRMLANNIFNNFIFIGGESLGGALWFVPMMLIGITIFAFILCISSHFFYKFKIIPITILCVACGLFGLYCNINNNPLFLHAHSSFLLIPFLFLGYLISYYKIDVLKLIKWPIALICGAAYIYLFAIKGCRIDLSKELIISQYMFYPATLLGIYFVCFIAKMLAKFKPTTTTFSFIGKYSFDIMALHFLIFKIIDVLFGLITKASPEVYSAFPCAYPKLWPIYLAVSLLTIPFIRLALSSLYAWLTAVSKKLFS